MPDYSSLQTYDAAAIPGSPPRYCLYHESDYLEVRSYYGSIPDGFNTAIARFLSNKETHLYGECILHDPAIRSFGVLSLTNMNQGEDIVSFRSGNAVGDEQLRILSDGTIRSADGQALLLKSAADSTSYGVHIDTEVSLTAGNALLLIKQLGSDLWSLSNDGIIRSWHSGASGMTLYSRAAGDTPQTIRLDGSDIHHFVNDLGHLKLTADGSGALTLASRNYADTADTDLTITADDATWTADTIKLLIDGNEVNWSKELGATKIRCYQGTHIVCRGSGATDWKSFVLTACDISIVLPSGCDLVIYDGSEAETITFKNTGAAALYSTSGNRASLNLDSTRNDNGRRWQLSSDHTGTPYGSLRFINLTDEGYPTVEIDRFGSLWSHKFLGSSTVTSAPSDSEGRVGGMVVDTSNKRLWVKVASTGENRWWYTPLTEPA